MNAKVIRITSTFALVLTTLLVTRAQARPPVAAGMVNLPYSVPDGQGNQWVVYQNGMLQQQGNVQMYSQGAMLLVNGNQAQSRINQAKLDEKTGELIFENMNANGVMVTRRILINKEENYVRYIDVFQNSTNRPLQVNVIIQTNLNYGVQTSVTVPDPRKKDQQQAWVAFTGGNRAVMEMFAGPNSKLPPTITAPQGNNYVQAAFAITVPAGKESALMHVHSIVPTQDAGVEMVKSLKMNKLMANVPPDIRKLILNFATGQDFAGELEILRGDVLDVIELQSGDQMKGTIKDATFKLKTAYGDINQPVDKIVAMINVGRFRPRQLFVTVDGEIYGGKLQQDTISMELSSGQKTQVPIGQIQRLGMHKRAGEPEEWTFNQPMVMLRSGDRMALEMPTGTIDVHTRYGTLQLAPANVAAIVFQSEEHGVHDVYLTDGSKFAGLFVPQSIEIKLVNAGDQVVNIPVNSLARLQLGANVEETPDDAPQMQLSNNDLLVGMLQGELKLDTAFDTITIKAAEVKHLQRSEESSGDDVQVELWDASKLSGQLQDPTVRCQLLNGTNVDVPVALIQQYNQPTPQASPSAEAKIRELVAKLDAVEWTDREEAKKQLIKMGEVVGPVLRSMRADQSAEGRERIDVILKELGQSADPKGGRAKVKPKAGQGNENADPGEVEGMIVVPNGDD